MNAPASLDSLRRNFPLWMPVLVVLLGLANGMVMPLASADGGNDVLYLVLLAGLFGIITVESGILAVWLVWNEWPLPLRLALHWLAGLFLFGCWGLGYLLAVPAAAQLTRDHRIQELADFATCLPAISLAVQTPLWIARSLCGWRLQRSDTPADADSKLSIRNLLVATAIVAASIGCLRIGARTERLDNDFWLACGITGAALLIASAVVILPVMVILLRTKKNESGIGGALAWCLGLGIIIELPLLTTLGAIGAPRAPDAWLTVAVVTVYVASALATVAVPLAIARSQGYRLCFRRDVQDGTNSKLLGPEGRQ